MKVLIQCVEPRFYLAQKSNMKTSFFKTEDHSVYLFAPEHKEPLLLKKPAARTTTPSLVFQQLTIESKAV